MCTYHCTQLSYTMQHSMFLINFHLNLKTIIIGLMQSTRREGVGEECENLSLTSLDGELTQPLNLLITTVLQLFR